ncbi:asparagine--tRNA ligase [Thermoplasmatales archaeon ex4484_6]|nr:MAG: asparagine--tRNA ligase [Thermoplasmatales archaeon ex4484_6]RLF69307.1 MAG: asparagine--tRNA ligase [Thermoplasmata archaeon]
MVIPMDEAPISIQEAKDPSKQGNEVTLRGWIYRTRGSNRMLFLVLRDSTDIIQCVASREDLGEERFISARELPVESAIVVKGRINMDDRAPGGFEVHLKEILTISKADRFPITKDHSEEFLRENRHLWLRSRKMNAIMKVRSTVTGAIHEFFRREGYHEFTPPIFTPNQAEGGSTLFEVKYYDRTIYLSQTWQLYAEAAIFSLERIYDVSPTFRAERSKTSRHLSEFWMAEMEAAWMDYLEAVSVAEREVKFIIEKVLERNMKELEILEAEPERLRSAISAKWPVITYTEALGILKERSGMDVEWGKDLRTVEEEELMKHFDTPITVVEYPKEAMAFYKPVKEEADAPGPVAKCFDMIAPGGYGEIVGGSERDTDAASLEEALKREGEDVRKYDWYLDLRRYGSVQHSGYGLGVERVLAWICKLDNIKDAIPFPRTMTRAYP